MRESAAGVPMWSVRGFRRLGGRGAGSGGGVADVVGSRLQALGERFQVLCITHLPQIAARGATQFLIEKSVRGDRTVTRVEQLDAAGRVEEIARMIGGASVTDQVRASARELLDVGSKRTRPGQEAGAGGILADGA